MFLSFECGKNVPVARFHSTLFCVSVMEGVWSSPFEFPRVPDDEEQRRMLRRLRSHWRHEQFSIRMALAGAVHHSHMRAANMATQTGFVLAATYAATAEAPQVVCSFPLSDDFAAPMYNQVHQEQIVTTVQPHAIFQETPGVQVVERILEQIVESIEVLPHERAIQRTAKQIVHVPVPQI